MLQNVIAALLPERYQFLVVLLREPFTIPLPAWFLAASFAFARQRMIVHVQSGASYPESRKIFRTDIPRAMLNDCS